MKSTITYKLPEEKWALDMALQSKDLAFVILDLDQYLREKIQYEDLLKDKEQIYQEIRDHLHELLHDKNLNIEKLRGE